MKRTKKRRIPEESLPYETYLLHILAPAILELSRPYQNKNLFSMSPLSARWRSMRKPPSAQSGISWRPLRPP